MVYGPPSTIKNGSPSLGAVYLHDEINLSRPGGWRLQGRERVQVHTMIIHDSRVAEREWRPRVQLFYTLYGWRKSMFSKLSEFLNKLDDEKFSADISTPERRNEKIAKLRSARSIQLLLNIFLIAMLLLLTYLFPKGDLSILFWLSALCVISLGMIDSQIKMLLLQKKA